MLRLHDPLPDTCAHPAQTTFAPLDLALDVLHGLSAHAKSLPSRWFYDDEGSRLFQQIMALPEYYLTRTEHRILQDQATELVRWMSPPQGPLHLVELGSGDGEKTLSLCHTLSAAGVPCIFHPIDVSKHALSELKQRFEQELPDIRLAPVLGSYFEHWPALPAQQRQAVLLLGSNLGNLSAPQAIGLLTRIRMHMRPGDVLLLGLDLQKDPYTILSAYNDSAGITAAFNLNLLRRLNTALEMNFDLAQFRHYPTYSPFDGAARSFLVSLRRQTVHSRRLQREFTFQAGEAIYTEQSQKYSLPMIDELARAAGLEVNAHHTDEQHWYTIAVLQARGDTARGRRTERSPVDMRQVLMT